MAKQEGLQSAESKKPRLFYGYIVVLAAFVIIALAFGINYTFGVFFKPLLAEFGWTRAVTSVAYSLSTLVAGFLGIFAGKLSDRFGAKIVSIACGLFLGSGFMLMSRVNAIWQVYLFYSLIIAAGIGGSWPALIPAVAKWFAKRRGLMTGTVVSGIGVGILIIPPLASRLISIYEWRSSYLIIGIISLVLILLAAQFLRQSPRQIEQLPYGENEVKRESSVSEDQGVNFREAVHTKQFWIVCTIYFCFGFGLHTVMVHIVPHATDLGISVANAVNILAMIGGAGIFGSITMGSASDRIGIKPSLIFTLILMLSALLWLQLAKELWMLYLFGIVFGLACRSIIALQSLVTAELFGLSSLGILVGSVAFIYTIGAALGPALSGHIFDITGSYSLAFLADAILVAIALILALLLRPLRSEGGENETRRCT